MEFARKLCTCSQCKFVVLRKHCSFHVKFELWNGKKKKRRFLKCLETSTAGRSRTLSCTRKTARARRVRPSGRRKKKRRRRRFIVLTGKKNETILVSAAAAAAVLNYIDGMETKHVRVLYYCTRTGGERHPPHVTPGDGADRERRATRQSWRERKISNIKNNTRALCSLYANVSRRRFPWEPPRRFIVIYDDDDPWTWIFF